MKAVILAGGLGTRLAEETTVRPKPMVEIGGKPILWHIMRHYSRHGIREFVICLGYKGHLIKEWFSNYFLYSSDVTFDLRGNRLQVHHTESEDWKVTLLDTGEATQTGGRLRRIREHVSDGTFCATYGDGLSDVDVGKLIDFHRKQKTLATLTAVQPPGRFGTIDFKRKRVVGFHEKPPGDGTWINGGYFVLEPKALDLIEGDDTSWERGPMETLAGRGELAAFRHDGFWQCMDTVRDRTHLEELWNSGRAPWKPAET
ncbi:MAG TPA: glucose-1-phosphate cytidylyltransferase [Fibrobacteria bacterium]|nr:glucose-1-phosphate cytidylyltransferase [Fibrobacteria bacterium]HOX52457.1 glucose-1-phosphate cytidylyltransferase [Fibrobacteria bacterium]